MRSDKLVGKKFTEFFFPTILMSASASLSIIIDSIIVGNVLGDSELAAVNLIMPLSLCFTAVSAMFGIGSATCISVFRGKMDTQSANKCLTLSCMAWLLCSVIGVLLALFGSSAIAGFLSGNSGLDPYVYDYLKVYLLGSPFTFATLIFPHIIKTDGMPRLSSNALIAANAANLVLDIVFMEFLQMGIAGGALATVTGNLIGTLLFIAYIKSKGRTLHLKVIRFPDFKLYADMFKMSISSIFGQALMFAKMWVFNMIVSKTAGQAGLTAFSICTSCLSFVSMFISGGAQTMIPMVGAFGGAKDDTAIAFTVKKAFKLIIGCCLAVTALFELFPEMVLQIYGVTGGAVMELGIMAVRLFSIAFVGIGFSFMFMYYVQARKMPAFSMQICALEGFFVIVPVCFLFSLWIGSAGVWLSYTVNEILVALFIGFRVKSIVRKSEGSLYSLFMLAKPSENKFELSVDVSDEAEIKEAVRRVSDYVQKAYPRAENTEPLLACAFDLSKCAYREKSGRKAGFFVDVIVEEGKLSFKDMGMDYERIETSGHMEKMKEMSETYTHTLMIGMNYSAVTVS